MRVEIIVDITISVDGRNFCELSEAFPVVIYRMISKAGRSFLERSMCILK